MVDKHYSGQLQPGRFVYCARLHVICDALGYYNHSHIEPSTTPKHSRFVMLVDTLGKLLPPKKREEFLKKHRDRKDKQRRKEEVANEYERLKTERSSTVVPMKKNTVLRSIPGAGAMRRTSTSGSGWSLWSNSTKELKSNISKSGELN